MKINILNIIKIWALVAVFALSLGVIPLKVLGTEQSTAHAIDNYFVTEVLSGENPDGAWVQNLYDGIKTIINIGFVLILIAVAFANILHIQIDTYAIKKILPTLFIVVVLANLAMPIFAVLSSVVDSILKISIFKPYPFTNSFDYFFSSNSVTDIVQQEAGGGGPVSWVLSLTKAGAIIAVIASILAAGTISIITVCCACVLLFAPAIALALLAMIMSFRPYIVFILVALAPAGLALSILPQTQNWHKKWLSTVIIWLTMPIVINLIFNVGDMIPMATYIGGDDILGSIIGVFLPVILKMGLVLLAVRYPFMIEKDISGLIHTLGKGVGKFGMSAPGRAASWMNQNRAIGNWAKMPENTWRGRAGRVLSKTSDLLNNPGTNIGKVQNRILGRGQRLADLQGQLERTTDETEIERIKDQISQVERQMEETEKKWARWTPKPIMLSVLPQVLQMKRERAESDIMDAFIEDTEDTSAHLDNALRNKLLAQSWAERFRDMTPAELQDTFQEEAEDKKEQILSNMGSLKMSQQKAIWTRRLEGMKSSPRYNEDQQYQEYVDDLIERSKTLETPDQINSQIAEARQSGLYDSIDDTADDFDTRLAYSAIQYYANMTSNDKRTTAGEVFQVDPDSWQGLLAVSRTFMANASATRPRLGLDIMGMTSSEQERQQLYREIRGINRGLNDNTTQTQDPDDDDGSSEVDTDIQNNVHDEATHGAIQDLGRVYDSASRESEANEVELSSSSIEELSNSLVRNGSINSSPGELASVAKLMKQELSDTLSGAGMDEMSVNKMIKAFRDGQVNSAEELSKYLPENLAAAQSQIFKKMGDVHALDSMAIQKQVNDTTTSQIQTLAQKLQPQIKATNPQEFTQAAAVVIKHEEASAAREITGNVNIDLPSEAQLSNARKYLASKLSLPEMAIDGGTAKASLNAYGALMSREGQTPPQTGGQNG